jgi:Protein of unknown function (DUF2934)
MRKQVVREQRSRHSPHTPVLEIQADDRVPDMPFTEGSHSEIDPDLRHRMISEAAYELYQARGYCDGYDVDDWLQAEAEIDHILLNPERLSVSDICGNDGLTAASDLS